MKRNQQLAWYRFKRYPVSFESNCILFICHQRIQIGPCPIQNRQLNITEYINLGAKFPHNINRNARLFLDISIILCFRLRSRFSLLLQVRCSPSLFAKEALANGGYNSDSYNQTFRLARSGKRASWRIAYYSASRYTVPFYCISGSID